MASHANQATEIATLESPGPLAKAGSHVAPLVHWKTSTPIERAVAGGKVGAALVAVTGAGIGVDAAMPLINSVPYAETGLLAVATASVVTGAATVIAHRTSETLTAKQISSTTKRVAVTASVVAGAAAVADLTLFHGTGVVGQIVTDSAGGVGAIALASGGASALWSRAAKREGAAASGGRSLPAASPSLMDMGNY